jgi:two-component system cell cycle sensor histidine kinase/response regulator CckA
VAVGQPFYPEVTRAFTTGFNFLFLNALVAFSIAGLTEGLQSVIIRANQARDDLVKEVDARKQTERFLQASEEKYRLLAENLSDILWSMDMDLNFTYMSPAAQTLLGWSADELKKLSLADTLTAESLDKALALINGMLAKAEKESDYSKAGTINLELRRKDGRLLQVEVRGAFLLGEDGRPIGILGITQDISGRIQARKEKEALQSRLAQSKKMEAVGLLASGVAHDLNNVLSGIVSYPDLLLLDLPADSPLRKPLETIRQTGNKAAEIVQDLLTLSRRNVQTMNVISVNQVVAEHLSSPEHKELLSRYPGVVVQTELAPGLANINGSSIHLIKALMNLIINAAEAQPQGGLVVIRSHNCTFDKPPKSLSQMPPGTYVCLEVSDKGAGIPEADLQRIFEPFFTRRVMGRSGSGLGMAVVWGTVQDHNGYISVHSKELEGTTFKLYFPTAGELQLETQKSISLDGYLGNGETILVVDDVVEQREIAADILHRLGYRAITAASGKEALDYLKQCEGAVDAIILDMIMPGMDGLDTYRAIRERHADMRVMIASGFSETQRVKEALGLGVGAYIRKPYMLKDIGPALRKILS